MSFLDIIGVIWPAGSAVAWLTGTTVLQTRARSKPFDLRLNGMILMITVVAFHLVAYTDIAARKHAMNLAAIPMVDFVLIGVALIGIKRRVHLTERCFWMFVLIFVGSLSLWLWLIEALGGLMPK